MNRKQRRIVASEQRDVPQDNDMWAEQLFRDGLALHQQGKAAEAEKFYREILARKPRHSNALHLLGMAMHHQGRTKEAIPYLQQVLQQEPHFAEGHSNLGNLYMAVGDYKNAEAAIRKCIALKPEFSDAYGNLGNVIKLQKRPDEALTFYRKAIEIDPKNADAYSNLGTTLQEKGQLREARDMLMQALQIQPKLADALNSLGVIFHMEGDLAAAISLYQKAIEIKPDYAEALTNLGNALKDNGRWQDAAVQLRKVLELKPNMPEANGNLALILRDQCKIDEARECYRRANLTSFRPHYAYRQLMLCSPIPQSSEEIASFREGLTDKIQALAERVAGKIPDPNQHVGQTPFFAAYQGYDDRPLMETLHRFFTAASPALSWQAPHIENWQAPAITGRKIKIGIMSAYMYDHTIAKLMLGMIAELPRDMFDVTVIKIQGPADFFWEKIRRASDRQLVVPRSYERARELVSELALDVLYYADIGMEPLTYFLGFSRLAPVQCVTWGHPDTTGLPTMDYFISSKHVEPENSDQHYTEKLVRLDTLPSYYYRPQMERQGKETRQDFKLPEDKTIYLCPQSLFKLHPMFDETLGALLRQDPAGELVFIEGYHPEWTQALKQRFQRSFPDVADRVRFVPRVNGREFLWLLGAADVILDPPHFGGGNTSYEALGVGMPVVTLPGPFMRGRVTSGCYQQMGIPDLIAKDTEDYVRIATRLGQDKAWREEMSAMIKDKAGALFEIRAFIDGIAAFLIQAVNKPAVIA